MNRYTQRRYIYTFKSSVKVKLLLKTRNEIEHFYFWGRVRRAHLSRGLLVVSVFTDFPLILFLARDYSVLYKQKIKNVTKFIKKKIKQINKIRAKTKFPSVSNPCVCRIVFSQISFKIRTAFLTA